MARSETDLKFEELIAESDRLIKAGKINSVSLLMSRLSVAQVPRKFRQDLAKICRRAGLVSQGLRLLQPVIRNEAAPSDPTAAEICEYSILLSRNGSVQEALNLLSQVDGHQHPEALTASAYCFMARWEYKKVAGLLERFLKSDTDSYSKLVATLNLASAYLEISQLEQASELANETIAKAETIQATRLIANALEIRGQVHFRNNNFAMARSDLKAAREIFASNQTYDELFIQQWFSIMQSIEEKSVAPLLEFRSTAVERKLWESVREADFYTIQQKFDQRLWDHLMYGTPLQAYRERIQKAVGQQASETFIFGRSDRAVLDLCSGSLDCRTPLNAGKKIHQTLSVLLQDFYVPRNIGSLFAELYPNEFFNVNSSRLRIHQLLARTRRWLLENQIPASIQILGNTYRFQIHGALGVKLDFQGLAGLQTDPNLLRWNELKAQMDSNQWFSAPEACEKMNWSRSSFRLAIQVAVATGEVQKIGVGKATLYLIHSETKNNPSKAIA